MKVLTYAMPDEIEIIIIRSREARYSLINYITIFLTGVIYFMDNVINYALRHEFIIGANKKGGKWVLKVGLYNISELLSCQSFGRVRYILLEPLSKEVLISLCSSGNVSSVYYVHGREFGGIVNECLHNSSRRKLYDLEINISRIRIKSNNISISLLSKRAATGSKSFTLNLIKCLPKVIGAFDDIKKNARGIIGESGWKRPGYLEGLAPRQIDHLKYLVVIILDITLKLLKHVKRKRNVTWSILLSCHGEASIVAPRAGHLIADPFVVEDCRNTYIFTEDFDFQVQRNCIALFEYRCGDGVKFLGEVIKSESWLSCPCIYKPGENFYMICDGPGTDIITYKCLDFPLKWVSTESIMEKNFRSESHFIIFRDGYWYLFLSPETCGDGDFNTRLDIYYSSDAQPNSWRPHPANPVFIGSSGAKTGGLYEFSGDIFRVGRRVVDGKCGYSIRVFKITSLTPNTYNEEIFMDIDPIDYVDSLGCMQIHHLHRSGSFIAMDYMHPLKTGKW